MNKNNNSRNKPNEKTQLLMPLIRSPKSGSQV